MIRKQWPIFSATILFFAVIVCIQPWSELPINDDWQYAHVAKVFAERGILRIDVPVAPTLVGQSLIAWPVIRIFGFSHLALRILTLVLSVLILVEIDYLLSSAAVSARIRFVALSAIIANPLFLHFSTSFMTENYGYFVALLAACIWFYGRKRNRAWYGVVAALIAGGAFWIRQFSALVFPALILAELMTLQFSKANLRTFLAQRTVPMLAWAGIIAAYFPWAKASGNYTTQFSHALAGLLTPVPIMVFVESGVYIFYLTFFFAPFLLAYFRRERPSIPVSLFPAFLIITAILAWRFGDKTHLPAANLHAVFPFLHNVLASYGVGPVTLTDVYLFGTQTRPRVSDIPWLLIEVIAIALSVAWGGVIAQVRARKNEIGIFGICLALISLGAVLLASQSGSFDRYHFPGVLGFAIALAAFFPSGKEKRLYLGALVWLTCLGVFSTLSLHDYFRWNEARDQILTEASRGGISAMQIDAGYEPNGWNSVNNGAMSAPCEPYTGFCPGRPYRIGLEQTDTDKMILSRPVDAWLVRFPDVKLLKRQQPFLKPTTARPNSTLH